MIVGETLKMMMIKLTLVLKFVIAICLFHSIVSLTLPIPKKFVLVTGGVLSGMYLIIYYYYYHHYQDDYHYHHYQSSSLLSQSYHYHIRCR